jgi:hypothetical protein
MSNVDEAIKRDIAEWGNARLNQWYKDLVVRYEIVDCDMQETHAEILMILFGKLAVWMAHSTDLDSREIGNVMSKIIDEIRRKHRRTKDRP